MFTGLGEYGSICIKASVAPEEAACYLINYLQGCCSVAKLHCGKCRLQVFKRKMNLWNKNHDISGRLDSF